MKNSRISVLIAAALLSVTGCGGARGPGFASDGEWRIVKATPSGPVSSGSFSGQGSVTFQRRDDSTTALVQGICGPVNVSIISDGERFKITDVNVAASACADAADSARQQVLIDILGKGDIHWSQKDDSASISTGRGSIELHR